MRHYQQTIRSMLAGLACLAAPGLACASELDSVGLSLQLRFGGPAGAQQQLLPTLSLGLDDHGRLPLGCDDHCRNTLPDGRSIVLSWNTLSRTAALVRDEAHDASPSEALIAAGGLALIVNGAWELGLEDLEVGLERDDR